jgi:hypothetical protein
MKYLSDVMRSQVEVLNVAAEAEIVTCVPRSIKGETRRFFLTELLPEPSCWPESGRRLLAGIRALMKLRRVVKLKTVKH